MMDRLICDFCGKNSGIIRCGCDKKYSIIDSEVTSMNNYVITRNINNGYAIYHVNSIQDIIIYRFSSLKYVLLYSALFYIILYFMIIHFVYIPPFQMNILFGSIWNIMVSYFNFLVLIYFLSRLILIIFNIKYKIFSLNNSNSNLIIKNNFIKSKWIILDELYENKYILNIDKSKHVPPKFMMLVDLSSDNYDIIYIPEETTQENNFQQIKIKKNGKLIFALFHPFQLYKPGFFKTQKYFNRFELMIDDTANLMIYLAISLCFIETIWTYPK